MASQPVVIIGAGLSGLVCAKELVAAGEQVLVLEASDKVGGRVRTDHVEGFQLDRGFQVLLTSYPEAASQLDYEALSLGVLYPVPRLEQMASGLISSIRCAVHQRRSQPWLRQSVL